MKRLGCGLAMSVVLCSSAFAADPPPAPAAQVQAPPSAHSIELARRYLIAVHYDAVIDRMIGILLPPIMKLATDHATDLSASQKADLVKAMGDAFAEWRPKYVVRFETEIARIYTDEELEAVLAFYESPVGKSFIAKQGVISDAGMRVSHEMQPELKELMQDQICKRLNCSKLKPPLGSDKS